MEEDKKAIAPWLWKKGQSGNPSGKPKGALSMKKYVQNRLLTMTEDEREEFLEGISKDAIWKMAEGNPETKTDIKIGPKITFTEEEILEAQKIIDARNGITNTTTETGTGNRPIDTGNGSDTK